MNDEYSVKLALIEEFKKVLKYKKIYEDLVESFQYMIADLFQYADKQKIDLPNRDRIYRNMERSRESNTVSKKQYEIRRKFTFIESFMYALKSSEAYHDIIYMVGYMIQSQIMALGSNPIPSALIYFMIVIANWLMFILGYIYFWYADDILISSYNIEAR